MTKQKNKEVKGDGLSTENTVPVPATGNESINTSDAKIISENSDRFDFQVSTSDDKEEYGVDGATVELSADIDDES